MKKPATMFEAMSAHARETFEACGRSKAETCRALEISYHTLNRYLKGQPSPAKARARARRRASIPKATGLL